VGKVAKGKEAGLLFQGDVKLKEDDLLLVFRKEKEKAGL